MRIANVSGFFGDRMSALREMITGGPVDVITGDYLAEVTMMILGKQRAKNPALGYAPTFLAQIEPVLDTIVTRGIKVVVNAGGLNPAGLAAALRALGEKAGQKLAVASVDGDDVAPRLAELRAANRDFASLESGAPLPAEPGFVYTANAYLGAWGIVRALEEGADIVVCPRVTDASLLVGPAAWWHGWSRTDHDALAGAVVAGHVIECGAQATGGNYSSFRDLDLAPAPGFPFADVAADGSSVIGKHDAHPGAVTVGTVTAQLVYEIGSPAYLNPDVVAHLDTITIEAAGPDRVALRGTRGSPPPETTKVAITCKGTFQNEMTFAFVGLDVDEKIALFERGVRAAAPKLALEFQRIGSAAVDAERQDDATVLLRVVASGADEKAVSRAFSSAVVEQALSSYPGLFATDVPGPAREAGGYWPTLVRQADLAHRVTHHDGRTEAIAPPESGELRAIPAAPVVAWSGPTERGPLGRLVDARSGDKGSDANLGLWTRSDDVYAWLRQELTVAKLRELLPEARALPIERHELPNLRALNFLIHDLLAGGAVATLRFDRQAKALGEYVRSRWVDLPTSNTSS